MKTIYAFVLGTALSFAFAASVSGCTASQFAQADAVFKDVLSGIQHGETLEQIELQVANDAGFSGTVNTIVVTIVVDALDTLIALGVIPPNLVPTATAMEVKEADKLTRMGGKAAHALRSIATPAGLLVAVSP